MSEVPTGWERCEISDVLAAQDNGKLLKQGWSPKCEKHPALTDSDWGVLKTTSIQSGSFLAEYNKALPDSLHPRPSLEVAVGDLLITCAGPRSRCGVPCLVRSTRPRLMISGKMYKMRVSPQVLPAFAEAWLLSSEAQKAVDRMKTGGSDSGLNLTQGRFLRLPFFLAPFPEQQRIVAKIESLFARLDEGIAALRRAQANLKRYRTSVLKAAVEGRLTERWRHENPPEETGKELLRRILTERRRRWETEQLAKFEAKGKKPPRNWKAKYKEPVTPDTSGLPKLPEGWCWATVAMLIREPLRNGRSAKASKDGTGVRTLTLSAVTEGDFSEHNTKVTTADPKKVRDLWLAPEDILVERSNTPELVGLACMYRGPPDYAIFPDLLIRVRCVHRVAAAFVELCLQSPDARSYLRKQARGSAGSMPKISQNMLAELTLPVPPRAEQDEILTRFGSLVASAADLMSGKVATATRRVVTLRQSILRRAFEGHLVPQDPNDEPASAVLERLRAEKEANKSGRRSAEPKCQRRSQVA